MKHELKITQIGNSLGLILPKDLLAELKLAKGDVMIVSSTPEGIKLTPYDPDVARQLEAGRDIMKQYRNTLRELAK